MFQRRDAISTIVISRVRMGWDLKPMTRRAVETVTLSRLKQVIHPILASHCQKILFFEAPAVWINAYKSLVSFIYRNRCISLYLFVGHHYLSIAQLIHFEAIGGY